MPKKKQFPEQGDVLAFLLEDGRYSACRVIHTRKSSLHDPGCNCVLVACCGWIGNVMPGIAEPGLREILKLNHHRYANEPALAWVSDPVPKNFIYIGNVAPLQNEAEIRCTCVSDWRYFPLQSFTQWEWENDIESVRRKDAEREEAWQKAIQERQAQRDAFLAKITLADLLEYTFFAKWRRYPSKKLISASREIMHSTVEKLHNHGEPLQGISKVRVMKSCIDRFNELDAKHGFIETTEREDICAEFEVIAHACGLGHYENLADHWRDW
mgnify:CR=1 FL=1